MIDWLNWVWSDLGIGLRFDVEKWNGVWEEETETEGGHGDESIYRDGPSKRI